jgi:hypothetical protein
MLMLLRCLAASTSPGAIGSVTQLSTLLGSASTSQSSISGPPFTPSPDTSPWYLDSSASFHMTHHSAHLSSMRPSYHHLIVHTADGSTLSVVGQGTLCSVFFHVPDVSLIPNLTMIVVSFFTLIFAIVVTHNIFESLSDFIFLLLHSLVMLALPSLLHLCHHFLSGIIIWDNFVAFDCLHCFVKVF